MAFTEAERAVVLNPNDPEAHLAMGLAMITTGRPEAGLEFIETALRLNPSHPVHYVLAHGMAYFAMDDLEQAAAVLKEALDRDPGAVELAPLLAATYAHVGRRKDARAVVQQWRPDIDETSLERIGFAYHVPYPQGKRPQCDDPTGEKVALGVLSLGIYTIVREAALDCPDYSPEDTSTLLERAEELLDAGDAAEQFQVGHALWYRREKELGDRLMCLSAHQRLQKAQHWMARKYQFGYAPVQVDSVQAYKWYSVAFYGADYADKMRSQLSPHMTPAQIAEAERLAAEWEPNPAACEVVAERATN